MNTRDPRSTLRRVLDANAVFSATSGLYFLLAAKPLGEFLGASPLVMAALAVVRFGYAALVALGASRANVSRGFVLFTVLADSTWLLGSVLMLVLPLFHFTTDAKWAIGVTAICMDAFATLQFLEWRKFASTQPALPP
ncbi:MAG: hypothetical protein AB1750_04555 [Chloroflexota bacterium]